MVPCIIFEDEHLLVVNKPAGLNTHAPNPFAGEGIYDWLRHREPRWADLAIIHRLDKETSGLIVFGKTTLANRSLTEQFTQRIVQKKYLLLTDRPPRRNAFVAKTKIIRAGTRYASAANGEPAKTRFRVLNQQSPITKHHCIEAEPLTGRTHQIRVHAAENGFPILGDALYGGSSFQRVCLHAAELTFKHPDNGQAISFRSEPDFESDIHLALRAALIDPAETNAFRVLHGASDQRPGCYVDRLGDFLLLQSKWESSKRHRTELAHFAQSSSSRGIYQKTLRRDVRSLGFVESSPQRIFGEAAPERFTIRENGLHFELSFNEGYSVGLFLDQRDNRRRLQTAHIAAGFLLFDTSKIQNPKPEILNCFAYTCAFSVCAAKAGARTTSLDLSRKYLEWGARNFELNGLDPAAHDFIYGDVFDWLARLAKKKRSFHAVLLDPPTFSRSKRNGVFRAERNYGELIDAALPVLKPGGVLFASTNAVNFAPETFLATIADTVTAAGRTILQKHYVPQPPDFPISKSEPAYLKTVWLHVG